MKCLHPIDIKPPISHPNPSRTRFAYQVPCGKCPACLTRRQNDWAIRILMEAKYSNVPAWFVTLTYSDEHLPHGHNSFTLVKSDPLRFVKNLRQKLSREYGITEEIRYFLCGEYGDRFNRPHYHIVLFGLPLVISDPQRYLESIWNKGFLTIDELTPQRAKYVAKYVCKVRRRNDDGCSYQPPFALMSRMPAIGYSLLEQKEILNWHRRSKNFCMYDDQGTPYAMPKYYRDAIFSDKTRRQRNDMFQYSEYASTMLEINKHGLERWYHDSKVFVENTDRLFWKRIDDKLLK